MNTLEALRLAHTYAGDLGYPASTIVRRNIARAMGAILAYENLTAGPIEPLAVTQEEKAKALEPGGIIPAIKMYRARTGSYIKEAKDAIEAAAERKVGYPNVNV